MAVIWGAALPIVKPSLEFISPFQFLYLRYLIAAPLLLPVLIIYLFKIKPTVKTLLKIIALEFLGTAINLPILYYGLKLTSSIEASLIGAAGPVFTVLGGIIFLHEKESKKEWRGLALSFLGTFVLIIEPLLTGRNQTLGFSLLGNGLVLTYNLVYVVYVLLAKVHYRKLPKILVSSLSYPVALLSFWLLLTFTGLSTNPNMLAIPQVALAAGYMAIFGSIVAWTLFLYGQNLIEASEASLFTYLQGIVAIPVAWFFFQEIPSWPMAIAIILIAGGVILAEKRV
jgi:drug/metabolite transporter (DMT)-like permease